MCSSAELQGRTVRQIFMGGSSPKRGSTGHFLRQFPRNLRVKVVWDEMNQARLKSLARLFLPTGVPRQEILEKVGRKLGLLLLDDRKNKDSMLINCLNEDSQKLALELEGLELADYDGRIVSNCKSNMCGRTPFHNPSLLPSQGDPMDRCERGELRGGLGEEGDTATEFHHTFTHTQRVMNMTLK